MKKVITKLYHTSITAGNEVSGYTAASDFNTVGTDFHGMDAPWVLQVTRSASDGSPTVTVKCSENNSTWEDYNSDYVNVDVTTGEIFIDSEFKPRYMSIFYTSNGASGTITMILTRQENTN